jgi:hypothetical protein
MGLFEAAPDMAQQEAYFQPFSHMPQDDTYTVPPPNDPYDGSPWAMIELGVDEPLPLQDAIDELCDPFPDPLDPWRH